MRASLTGWLLSALIVFAAERPPMVGGPCTYTEYPGKARITRVEKTAESRAQAKFGASYEGYEIRFTFTPDNPIPAGWAHEQIQGEHLFHLANSWHPGPAYIAKYEINKDSVFPCTLGIIKTGTCTPVIWKLTKLDPADYFETELTKTNAPALSPAFLEETPVVPVDQEFGLKIGQTVAIQGALVLISFTAVTEDSRCPEGATCLFAGNSKIAIKLVALGSAQMSAELNTATGQKETAYRGYAVRLQSLSPYPRQNVETRKEDYVATLRVSKQHD